MGNNERNASNAKLLESIHNREAVVGIIGLGYVGLPLAIQFGKQGFKVIGFDLDTHKIDRLLHGESYIKHVATEPIKEMIESKQFDATIDFGRLAEADCILICVPTPRPFPRTCAGGS
jgi:UDP-N-acetyl-D-glucosamine dehydrogenase